MDLNRKGVFFTISVIALLTLFLISYVLVNEATNRNSEQKRVKSLDNFIFSIETDLERQLYVSGYRALFIMEKEAIEKGSYISNINNSVNELIMNGSFNGVSQPTMLGATLSNISLSISQKADKVSAEIFLKNNSITITQTDPWNVEIILTTNFYARDKSNLVEWNSTKSIIAKIPLNELEDPLYVLSTNGLVTNKIIKSPFSFTTNGSSNINALQNHTLGQYYISSTTAPSYLNRLEGISSPDPNGIESIINAQKLSSQGISVQIKSLIDFEYFSTNNPLSCQVSGMPSWFRISQTSLPRYNVSGLEYGCV